MEKSLRSFREDPTMQMMVSLIVAFLGLTLQFVSAWLPILDMPSTILSLFGLLATVYTFSKVVRAYSVETRHLLNQYLVDGDRFAEHPLTRTELARALRQLARSYWFSHKGGESPLVEDLESVVEARTLITEPDIESYHVPPPPTDVSWLWFRFRFRQKWLLRPLDRGYRGWLNPADAFGPAIVLRHDTYLKILQYKLFDPLASYYFPIAQEFAQDACETLPILGAVNYLQPLQSDSAGRNLLCYRLTKCLKTYRKATAHLLLEKCSTPDEIVKQMGVLGDQSKETRDEILGGVLAVYRIKPDRRIDQIRILQPDEEAIWEAAIDYDYILPLKLKVNGKVVLDQKWFVYPFGHVTTLKEFSFEIAGGSDMQIYNPVPSTALIGACKPEWLRGSKWRLTATNSFFFPSDSIMLRWDDDLISRL